MIPILSSKAAKPNQGLKSVPRKPREDNVGWLQRNLPASDQTGLVLVGGKGPLAFRLRAAQAHVRHDLMPSYWSHALLLDRPARNPRNTSVYEISLEPPLGFHFPPPTTRSRPAGSNRTGTPKPIQTSASSMCPWR